ncbi:MAG TPA: TonB-dependent receptor, partial [Bacteroidetes bacterium]|nr:TonB-dependent receptor [Bacteroidota bacterium]
MDVIHSGEINNIGNAVSPAQVLNTVPGLRFDERGAGGSRRVSIRGSVLRSPFGVQNIKAYIAGVPLTSPDGSTPLEVIDLASIGVIEVKKGQLGDEYGPGNGGVLQFDPNQLLGSGKWSGKLSFSAGSYGQKRWGLEAGYHFKKTNVVIRYFGQRYVGYRAQESNEKDLIFLHLAHRLGAKERWQVGLTAWLFQGYWELPGALTAAEAATNPRQALAFAKMAQAHVNRKRGRMIWDLQGKLKRLDLRVSIYGNLSKKLNPYGSSPFFQGYKDENLAGTGARVTVATEKQLGNRWTLVWTSAAEFQLENKILLESENELGKPGNLRANTATIAQQTHLFSQFLIKKRNHSWALASGLNQVRFKQNDQFVSPNNFLTRKFPLTILPSLTYHFRQLYALRGPELRIRLATGYSPPSLVELRQGNGSLNPLLLPESSIGLEVRPGLKFRDPKITGELNIYSFQVRNAILPKQLSSGETIFQNTDRTVQSGIEAMLRFGQQSKQFKHRVITAKAGFQHYVFGQYAKDSLSLKGKRLPGVPDLTASLSASTTLFGYFKLSAMLRFQGRSPA